MRFSVRYALLFLAIFLIETAIATFSSGNWIRDIFGDFLVVILIYSFFKIFIRGRQAQVAIVVFILALAVEISQYFLLSEKLSVADENWAQLTLGGRFDWWDILAYFLGSWVVLYAEFILIRDNPATK